MTGIVMSPEQMAAMKLGRNIETRLRKVLNAKGELCVMRNVKVSEINMQHFSNLFLKNNSHIGRDSKRDESVPF